MFRRDFLQSMVATACGLCLPSMQRVVEAKSSKVIPLGHHTVSLDDIVVNSDNVRMRAHPESDEAIIDSIRKYGVVQSLLCATLDDDPSHVELVCGYRRYHAVAVLGPTHKAYYNIPVCVRNFTRDEKTFFPLVESKPRVRISDSEMRLMLLKLIEEGYKTPQICERLCLSKNYVYKLLYDTYRNT